MGATSVRFLDYVVGSFGMIPGIIVFVYFGTALGSIGEAVSGNYSGEMT
jgi:uncharacterized membrane protein YdjX (TVP38/TMEM64 family)